MSGAKRFPGEIEHFKRLGIQFTEMWWPKWISTVFGITPHFKGLYKGLKLKFSQADPEISSYAYELSLYHALPLNLGLRCINKIGRIRKIFSAPIRKSPFAIFSKKVNIKELDMQCWAVDRERAGVLLRDEKVRKALTTLNELLKKLEKAYLVLNDKCITIDFANLPDGNVLATMCNLSMAFTNSGLAPLTQPAKIKLEKLLGAIGILLIIVLFIRLVFWIVTLF